MLQMRFFGTRLAGLLVIGCTLIGGSAPKVHAQWTVTNLHPAGAQESEGYGVQGNNQVGNTLAGGMHHASLWTGTASSWIDLSPAGSFFSVANGVSNDQQVGYAFVDGNFRASLWSGTSASWIDLHPPGALESIANGLSGGQQVGYAYVDGALHASLWNGTAASWIDLHPAGFSSSEAVGVSDGQQVGYTTLGADYRASLWSGSAASWVDLQPSGAASSRAFGASNGQQVGSAMVGGREHAGLWNGTAASWVDLHPPATLISTAYAVFGGRQVGVAIVGSSYHASLWSGSAASWVDLHALLPAGYSSSHARAIWSDANFVYVAGWGVEAVTENSVAFVWTCAIAGPPAGIVATDDFNYPNGHLGDQNGGFGWTIPWYTADNPNGGWEIASGEAVTTYVPYTSYTGRSFANPAATPELFIGLDIRTPATVDINDLIALYIGNTVSYSLVLGKAPGTSDFGIGGGSFGITPTGATINPNTTYHVIGVYDIDNQRVALWVNPDGSDYYDPTSGANSADAMQIANPQHLNSLLLNAFNPNGTQKEGMGFDNIVIGNAPGAVGLRSAAPTSCPGDLNGDQIVDLSDLVILLAHFGTPSGASPADGDTDGDSDVDLSDLTLLLSNFGATCP